MEIVHQDSLVDEFQHHSIGAQHSIDIAVKYEYCRHKQTITRGM